jgi:hypothetical protein
VGEQSFYGKGELKMRKIDEKNLPSSCWNKALDDEVMFVLLARDPDAPLAISAWMRARRDRLGPDARADTEAASACAAAMAKQHRAVRNALTIASVNQRPAENSQVTNIAQGCGEASESVFRRLLSAQQEVIRLMGEPGLPDAADIDRQVIWLDALEQIHWAIVNCGRAMLCVARKRQGGVAPGKS